MLREVPNGEIYYARCQLDGLERTFYDTLTNSLLAGKNTVRIPRGLAAQRAFEILNLVRSDHPEIYWVNVQVAVRGIGFRQELACGKGRSLLVIEKAMENARREALGNLPKDANDYTIAKAVFRYIVSHTEYDWSEGRSADFSSVNAHTLAGVFLDGKAVCEGYASAAQYLLQCAGVLAFKITGSATSTTASGPHAWLLVRINGDYYHFDPTWGDINSASGVKGQDGSIDVNYDYFCLTDREISVTHKADPEVELPTCKATKDSFYRREGHYFQIWSEQDFVDSIVRQVSAGSNYISVCAATTGVYDRMLKECSSANQFCKHLKRAWTIMGREDPVPTNYSYYNDPNRRTVHVRIC